MPFPGQTTTITVLRKAQDTTGRNPVYLGFQPTALTGVSINLRSLSGTTASTNAGVDLTGLYRGSVAIGTDIRVGDLLQDEQNNENDGNAIKFDVQECYPMSPFYLKLFLRRTSLG